MHKSKSEWVLGVTGQSQEIGFTRNHASHPIIHSGEGHLLTIGKTGSGKAISAAIPDLLTFSEGNAIVLDVKPELMAVTSRWRKLALGHRIIVLDPFGVSGLAETDTFNPLDIAKLCVGDSYSIAGMLASMITGAGTRDNLRRYTNSDQFWQDNSSGLLTGTIGAAIEGKISAKSGPVASLPAVRSLLKSDDAVYNMAVMLDSSTPSQPFREEIASFLQTTEVTRSGILSTLVSHFRGLSGENIDRFLSSTSFDLQRFVDQTLPATIYLLIPVEQLESADKLVRLILGTLMTALSTRRVANASRTLVQIDELASLGNFAPYRNAVTLLRGSSVVVHGLLQDLDQLTTNYTDARTILNNTSIIRFLGASNHFQAETIGSLFGISPRTLMNMESHEQLIVIEGKPQICRRVDYRLDSLYRGRFDPNPRYVQTTGRSSGAIEL